MCFIAALIPNAFCLKYCCNCTHQLKTWGIKAPQQIASPRIVVTWLLRLLIETPRTRLVLTHCQHWVGNTLTVYKLVLWLFCCSFLGTYDEYWRAVKGICLLIFQIFFLWPAAWSIGLLASVRGDYNLATCKLWTEIFEALLRSIGRRKYIAEEFHGRHCTQRVLLALQLL